MLSLFSNTSYAADALLVATDSFFFTRAPQLVVLAARHAIPTVYFRRESAAADGLMSYAAAFIIILQNLIFGTHSHPAVNDARSRRYRWINGSRRHVSDNG